MNYINSRVFAAIPVTITESVPTAIKITQDGILPIFPIQWTDTDIPVYFTLTDGNCSTIMHYASGDFDISSSLDSYCTALSTEMTAITLEPSTSFCVEGGYYKTTINIPTSAIPDPFYEEEENNCDPSLNEIHKYRKSGINARIYASGTFIVGENTYELEGYSDPFTVYRLEDYYNIRKINERDNLTELLKSQFPNFKQDDTRVFWDDYINPSLGTEIHDMNYSILEKIANYTLNNYDVETNEINALNNSYQLEGQELNKPNVEFPSEISRLMNLFSVHKDKLFGYETNDWEMELNEDIFVDNESELIGEELKKTDIILEPKTILGKHKSNTNILKYYVDEDDVGKMVSEALSATTETLYPGSVISEFCFYDVQPYEGKQIQESLIDFDNQDNWLTRVDYSEWQGNEKIMEEVLNYTLTKNYNK